VCVIDGRGGGLGSRLVAGLCSELGATQIGVGPRAIADALPTVDVIVTSLNLVLPCELLGQVTPEVVHPILGAKATKVLLPLNRTRLEIVGAGPCTLEALITQSLSRVRSLVSSVLPA